MKMYRVVPQTNRGNMVHLLHSMDVWTTYEEGRSRLSWVIDLKWFWRIWPGDHDILPNDTKINRVYLLPRMDDVWTKFEEGRSRPSWVIDRKQNVTDRPTDQPIDWPTDRHVQSNMPTLLLRGHNKWHSKLQLAHVTEHKHTSVTTTF